MRPTELQRLLVSAEMTAAVVDAIDDPILQHQFGWDLSDWDYEMIPWGVRFHQYLGDRNRVTSTIKTVILPELHTTRVPTI